MTNQKARKVLASFLVLMMMTFGLSLGAFAEDAVPTYYTISYYGFDGQVVYYETLEEYAPIYQPAVFPTVDGYEFSHWYNPQVGEEPFSFGVGAWSDIVLFPFVVWVGNDAQIWYDNGTYTNGYDPTYGQGGTVPEFTYVDNGNGQGVWYSNSTPGVVIDPTNILGARDQVKGTYTDNNSGIVYDPNSILNAASEIGNITPTQGDEQESNTPEDIMDPTSILNNDDNTETIDPSNILNNNEETGNIEDTTPGEEIVNEDDITEGEGEETIVEDEAGEEETGDETTTDEGGETVDDGEGNEEEANTDEDEADEGDEITGEDEAGEEVTGEDETGDENTEDGEEVSDEDAGEDTTNEEEIVEGEDNADEDETAGEDETADEDGIVNEDETTDEDEIVNEDEINEDETGDADEDADETEIGEEEVTEEVTDRSVSISMNIGEEVFENDVIEIVAVINGYEGLNYTLSWQYFDGTAWHTVEGANGLTHSFTLTEENYNWLWQLVVEVEEQEAAADQTPEMPA